MTDSNFVAMKDNDNTVNSGGTLLIEDELIQGKKVEEDPTKLSESVIKPITIEEPWTAQKVVKHWAFPWVLFVICLIVITSLSIALALEKSDDSDDDGNSAAPSTHSGYDNPICVPSDEGSRIDLYGFVEKVIMQYRAFYQHRIPSRNPEYLKTITDRSIKLKDELLAKQTDQIALTLNEKRIFSQVYWFLNTTFANPYGEEYYGGTWLLGPDFFCWQPLCSVKWNFASAVQNAVNNQDDSESAAVEIIDLMKDVGKIFEEEVTNMQMGVRTGFVRSIRGCRAGMNNMRAEFKSTTNSTQGRNGILNDMNFDDVLSGVKNTTYLLWEQLNNGMSYESTLRQEYLNTADKILAYFDYFNNTHLRHCPPASVVTGLSDLPLQYIYVDDVPGEETTPYLEADGEKFDLDGVETYKTIMKFFVPGQDDPGSVREVGLKLVDEFYASLLDNAKNYTGLTSESEIKSQMHDELYDQSQFFNDEPFPESESSSNPEAVSKCDSLENAAIHCPKRYEAIMKWFDFARDVTAKAAPLTVDYFHWSGPHRSTPNCPVDMAPDFNPFTAAQSYMQSDYLCSDTANYNIPFWTDNLGPKWQEYDTNVHEAVPGHHLQVQGATENFMDPGCTVYTGNLTEQMYFTDYTEGWALYSESPISVDMGIYEGEPLQAHGRYGGLLWRALRIVLDTGFGAFNLKFDESVQKFSDYLWDDTDLPQKETDRYSNSPGQALGYMWGRLFIIRMKKALQARIPEKKWDIKEFHYQYLSLAGTPLSYVETHLNQWADCVIDFQAYPNCDSIINPKFGDPSAVSQSGKRRRTKYQ